MKRPALIVLAVALVALVGAASWFYWPVYQVQSKVKHSLNDPDSAKFGRIIAVRATGAGCGTVNAKNRMGGYVGETEFVVKPDGSVVFGPIEGVIVTTEDKLTSLKAQLAFLNLAMEHCPDQ